MGNCFRFAVQTQKSHVPSRSERVRRRGRLRASAGRLVLGQKFLTVTLLALTVFISLSYLALINIRVTKGFEIKALEKRYAELEKNQKVLQSQAAELQSIQNIQQKINMSDYTPVTSVSYLKAGEYAINVVGAQPTP